MTFPLPLPKPKPDLPVSRLLTKRQSAEAAGLCVRSIDNAIARGELKIIKLGAAVRIAPDDLRLWFEANRI